MLDREKGIWSEFAEEELENNQEWDDNGLPENFTDKYHEDTGDEQCQSISDIDS